MKAFILTLFIASSVLAGKAQACERNKINSSAMLSNNNGNYYTVLKSQSQNPAPTNNQKAAGQH